MTAALARLLEQWNARADEHARLGSIAPVDKIVRAQMAELEETIRSQDNELLDLTTAAKESGYSDRALRTKLAGGELQQHGRKGSPRVRRGDLPRKTAKPTTNDGGYDPRADALRLERRG